MALNVVHSELRALQRRVSARFARVSSWERAADYVFWLIRTSGRDSDGTVPPRPSRQLERVLGKAVWDVDGLRDDVREYVGETLGSPRGILLAGTVRANPSIQFYRCFQRSEGERTRCRVCRVLLLTYASAKGRAIIDREVCTVETRNSDYVRYLKCRQELECCKSASTQVMLQAMLERVSATRMPYKWIMVGDSSLRWTKLRVWLQHRDIPYVTAIRHSDYIFSGRGYSRVDGLIDEVPPHLWRRPPVGGGNEPARKFSWVRVQVPNASSIQSGRRCWLLAARVNDVQEWNLFYLCYGRSGTTLNELACVASTYSQFDECLQQARVEVGLDSFHLPDLQAWYAHVTLSMLGLAGLVGAKVRLDQMSGLSESNKTAE